MINQLQKGSKEVSLKINETKTKVMINSKNAVTLILKQVDYLFIYLRQLI